ncbi:MULTISPECIES: hypothetical protein [Microcoleus]|uniref:hypothetical protein n=1 Tax=Microcoleus TaxID=44471 RepID=UPI001683B062|nr:hypothetical protein [Microcoleus sp. FACHB-84]
MEELYVACGTRLGRWGRSHQSPVTQNLGASQAPSRSRSCQEFTGNAEKYYSTATTGS